MTSRDLTDNRFGRWAVKSLFSKKDKKWLCHCDCGTVRAVSEDNLTRGRSQSCGCLRREMMADNPVNVRHGERNTPLYLLWQRVKQRCLYRSRKGYHRYGGRGISIHQEFLSYEGFRDYIRNQLGPLEPGLSLDRIDNDKGYEPGNLRWATAKEQARNTSTTKVVTVYGETLPLLTAVGRWGAEVGYAAVYQRVKRGWDPELALTTPFQKGKRRPTKQEEL